MQPAPPAPEGRRTRAATSLVIGTALLALLAALLLVAVLLQRDGGTGSASPGPSTSAGSVGASATQAGEAPVSSTTASPSGALAPDDLVRTTVDGLTLRAEPGRGAQRLGSLELDSVGFLMTGPVTADGYDWYLVSGMGLAPATGCLDPVQTDPYDCPIWLGYVAGADLDGTRWLEPFDAECTDPPAADLQALTLGHPNLELLHCYGDRELSFRAWWPDVADAPVCDVPDGPLWLRCPQIALGWGPDYPEAIRAAIDPASGVSLPAEGQWVEVTAELDHVESAGCADPADATAEDLRAILECRAQLVISTVEPSP
ncbi:MAG: hypothetical protein ACRDGJ_09420 [Candidatus Limnocylindria bacterium]